jgi:hypothetical protein
MIFYVCAAIALGGFVGFLLMPEKALRGYAKDSVPSLE